MTINLLNQAFCLFQIGFDCFMVKVGGFFTCVYFASGSKWGLSTPLTSGEFAGEKLLLLIALHSSSLALGKDGLSLTGGQNRDMEDWSQTGQAWGAELPHEELIQYSLLHCQPSHQTY